MNNRVNFDDYVENYNKLLKDATGSFSDDHNYFARYKAELTRRLIPSPVNPKRILEFGCGIGRNVPFLHASFPGSVVEGSDISDASIERAKLDFPDFHFFSEDENDPAQNLKPYDLVFVAGVFHHVPKDKRQQVMGLIEERMQPGAHLIIFEHNPYNPVTQRIVSNCPYDEDAVLLRPSELSSYVKASGMRVLGRHFCLFIPPRFAFLSQIEKHIGWLPLGGQYCVVASKD
jgi:SAM-dependent methyltransferase